MSMRRLLSSVAVVGVPVLVSALVVFAQVQTANQQKCLNGINKAGANVAKAQGKENAHCLKDAGNAKIPPGTAQSCLTADASGKVQKKEDKTTAIDAASCTPPPSFGFTGASTVNAAGSNSEVELIGDVFGGNLDPAVISCGSNKPGCLCQQKVLGVVEKLGDVKLGIFVKCKKAALKAGVSSGTALEDCINNAGTAGSIAADTNGKVLKAVTKLNDAVTKKCETPGVTAGSFPGKCTGLTGMTNPTLGSCLDQQVECRVCQLLNQADALTVDCDLFDNGTADASCANFPGPTPTPTLTATPTPTLTPSPTATRTAVPGFNVALAPATAGRFNYNATLGVPGTNAACNTRVPGTHTCTFAELQAAQTAGQLVGALDTANALVTSFWAIDSGDPPLSQCQDDVVTFQNWEYGTAHTGSRGERVTLTNGTGVLGSACPPGCGGTCIGGTNNGAACSVPSECPGFGAGCSPYCKNGTCVQAALQCNGSGSSWVGCCQ
jgi:hypothetical protein